jgi:hypothetical protein
VPKSRYLPAARVLTLLLFVSGCLLGALALDAQKVKPVPEIWQVTITPKHQLGARLSGYPDIALAPSDMVRLTVSLPNKQCACYSFMVGITRPAPDYLDFEDVGVAQVISDQGSMLEGGITGFLNSRPHPGQDDPYYRVVLWLQLPADLVDGIDIGETRSLNEGFIYLSFQSELDVNDSLYGFTTLDSLALTKTTTGWVLESNQGIELKEQKSEVYTYTAGKKTKTETRIVILQEIVTTPIYFRMEWTKVS